MERCFNKSHEIIKEKLGSSEEFNESVNYASKIFSMLGDPSRMKIILALMHGELCVYHICEIVNAKQSATSQHLKKLRDAKIVKCEKVGNQVLYSITDDHVKTIISMALEHYNC